MVECSEHVGGGVGEPLRPGLLELPARAEAPRHPDGADTRPAGRLDVHARIPDEEGLLRGDPCEPADLSLIHI